MIRPVDVDVIVAHPTHMDYPLFRYNMQRFRKYFNNIYIVKTQDTMPNNIFEYFVGAMDDVTFVKPQVVDGAKDWRSVAIRDVLINYSKSKYVLFLEQDFLIRDDRLFEVIYSDLEYDSYFYKEGDRIHPAFALTPRELIDRTAMDFGVQTQQYDHFGWFFKQLTAMTNHVFLEDIDLHNKVDYFHLAGFTNNYHVFNIGQPFYKPEDFLAVNYLSQFLPIKQIVPFLDLEQRITAKFGKGDYTGFLKDFFPKEEVK